MSLRPDPTPQPRQSESVPTCIGYGERDNRKASPAKWCKNPANTPARLWCEECEAERRKSITAQMSKITESFR